MPTGSRYQETRGLTRNELCNLIRADLKAAVADGSLPKAKYTVRKDEYAGGWHVYVTAAGLPFVCTNVEWFYRDAAGERHGYFDGVEYSEQARAVYKKIEGIVWAYNYDESDIQTDYFHVRFYSDVVLARRGPEHKQLWENVEKLRAAFPTTAQAMMADAPLDTILASVARAGGVVELEPKLRPAIPDGPLPAAGAAPKQADPKKSDAAKKAWATRRARENGNEPGPDINPETGERWGGDINAAWDDIKHGPAPRD